MEPAPFLILLRASPYPSCWTTETLHFKALYNTANARECASWTALSTSWVSPHLQFTSWVLPGLQREFRTLSCAHNWLRNQCLHVLELPHQNSLLNTNCFGHMLMTQGSSTWSSRSVYRVCLPASPCFPLGSIIPDLALQALRQRQAYGCLD